MCKTAAQLVQHEAVSIHFRNSGPADGPAAGMVRRVPLRSRRKKPVSTEEQGSLTKWPLPCMSMLQRLVVCVFLIRRDWTGPSQDTGRPTQDALTAGCGVDGGLTATGGPTLIQSLV